MRGEERKSRSFFLCINVNSEELDHNICYILFLQFVTFWNKFLDAKRSAVGRDDKTIRRVTRRSDDVRFDIDGLNEVSKNLTE